MSVPAPDRYVLAYRMQIADLSPESLASGVDMCERRIRDYLCGRAVSMTVKNRVAIANFLGIDEGELGTHSPNEVNRSLPRSYVVGSRQGSPTLDSKNLIRDGSLSEQVPNLREPPSFVERGEMRWSEETYENGFRSKRFQWHVRWIKSTPGHLRIRGCEMITV